MQLCSENPFYGKKAMLDLYHSIDNKRPFNEGLLTSAYLEAAGDIELRKGFWSLIFSIGDITDRQHNIFKRKVDGGGHADREKFHIVLQWMRKNHEDQYLRFMDLIVEYTGWDSLLANRVKTRKKTDKVTGVFSALTHADILELANFIVDYIRNEKNGYKLSLLAKRLVRIDNRTPKSREAKENRRLMRELYDKLSKFMDWEIREFENGAFAHTGLYEWRRKYIKGMEYYLFSTGAINEMGQEEFLQWLDNTPSSARRRVKNRLKNNPKWEKFQGWYDTWEKFKLEKQSQARELKEKLRQGEATEEEKAKLQEIEKQAKVNTGADNLLKELEAFLRTDDLEEVNTRAYSLLEKMKLNVGVLPIIDCSGSMGGYGRSSLPAHKIASLVATMVGLKNPSHELDNIFIRFGSSAQLIRSGDAATLVSRSNRFLEGTKIRITRIIDREKDFAYNYRNMSAVMVPSMGGTHLTTVSSMLREWANTPTKKEELQNYPVFLVISDGDINNSFNANHSVSQFMNSMRQIGWEGVLCIWDITSGSVNRSNLTEIPNVVHLMGWSTSIINQVFKNLHDLDVIDAYTPLQSLAKSNRYAPVRAKVI